MCTDIYFLLYRNKNTKKFNANAHFLKVDSKIRNSYHLGSFKIVHSKTY